MPQAEVFLTADARDDLRDLDGASRKVVGKKLRQLESDPELRGEPLGARQTSNLTGLRKVSAGRNSEWRIVFRVENDGTLCVVLVIGQRCDDHAYELAKARLKLSGEGIHSQLSRLLDTAYQK
jgi:mRNA interferase RelE/StbE